MNLYVLINIAILLPPLALSFDRKVAYYKNWLPLAGAIGVVSTMYIVWDVIVTARGHWGFNHRFAGGAVLGELPMGEILFFISVPYACIFIYEVVKAYFAAKHTESRLVTRVIPVVIAVIFAVLGTFYSTKEYTMLAFYSVALFFLVAVIVDKELFADLHTWMYFAVSYAAFLIVNGVLTGIPVVVYGEPATTGTRVFTIPIEDFFYNFGLLGFYLLFFRLFAKLRTRHG